MKRFFKFLSLFLFPILLVGILAEFLIQQIPNDYEYKKNYLDHHAKDVNILFLGSSHVYYGIDPKYIKSSFNAGHVSQSLDYDFEILKKYQDNWTRLKYIVIPIDYFSLYSRLENDIDSWRVKNYKIYYHIDRDHQIFNNAEMLSNNLEINLKRLYGYYLKKESDISCTPLGWGVSYNSKKHKDLIKTGTLAAERHSAKNYDQFKENIAVLNRIISFAERKKIRVVLFTSPAYHSYVSHLNKKQLRQTLAVANSISRIHTSTKYFNLLQDSTFHADDFYDGDHLNEIGAKKLSLKMSNIINNKKWL